MHSSSAAIPEPRVLAGLGRDPRSPAWPGWFGAVALVLAKALQVTLTWSVLRGSAATNRRPPSPSEGALHVTVLVLVNTLQVSLTWWIYRMATAHGDGPPPAIRRFSSSASRQLGGQ